MARGSAAAIVVLLLAMGVRAQPEPVDLVLVNGLLVDGTGSPGRAATIAVDDGRIVAIGPTADRPARERLDVAGHVVAPGFIDVHTHADDIDEHPLAGNFVRMGVTTIVIGNCGSSVLPIGEALERIHATGVAVNVGTLIGHNTVRTTIMGRERRDPSLSEMRRMRELIFRGMAEGALGFSTGLQYIPGTWSRSSEIIELARVAANEGGIYATHLRNEGAHLEAALSEAIGLARLLRMPLQVSHLKVDSPAMWGRSDAALAQLADARARGLAVQADQYAYTAGASSLSIRFPSWALEGGPEAVRTRLDSVADWRRIRDEMLAMLAERGFEDLSWATVSHYAPDPSLNGLPMNEVARRLVGDASVDSQLEAARRMQLGGGASMVYHFMQEADVERIMRDPFVSFASDAGVIEPGRGVPHPRGYGNTARVLGTYVRERKVLTLEEAVRRMTSLPSRHFALGDRGRVAVGAPADLVVFNPATVADRATFARPHAYPDGFAFVVVNGEVVVRSGVHTGARPGQVLRRQR